uniref:Uncharacterized protein n=1 Tax=Favella ehrenbergii TaxID=182087 RepID=A0A7S3MMG0_9SPIT|mmetsp:Transcript_24522/g.30581  ORF Transcript_24522/g.30581 Transcript_24522/m.30581 type:complete len:294 (+) Transcript_24522:585-1466(+)
MYERIMGSNPGGEIGRSSELAQDQSQMGTLIHNPTINQQIRNRHIVRNEFGQPVGKMMKKTFMPASKAMSKGDIKNDAFTIHETSYNAERERRIEEHIEHKLNILGGEFRCSKAFDNSMGPDWAQKSHKERATNSVVNNSMKRKTLMNTGDAFITGGNRFENHLADFDEMPRLSILNNYKRIKQIMNKNYVKGFEIEQKYANRTKQDNEHDPEFAKYTEEKMNSLKMSTILRSLNGTRKKKRTLKPDESQVGSTSTLRPNAQSVGQAGIRRRSEMSGIKPLQEAAEFEEISNF